MQGTERMVTSTVHEWVMTTPVDLKELEFAVHWARTKVEEMYADGSGSYDDAGLLVIVDESHVAMRVHGSSFESTVGGSDD